MSKRVEQTRQRAAYDPSPDNVFGAPDVCILLAHIATLTAETERLQREVAEGFKVEVADVTGDPAMMAENGRLKARTRALEAALEDFEHEMERDYMDRLTIVNNVPIPLNVSILRLWDRLRAALTEPTPPQGDECHCGHCRYVRASEPTPPAGRSDVCQTCGGDVNVHDMECDGLPTPPAGEQG